MERTLNTKPAETSTWKCLAFFASCYLGMMIVASLIISMFEFDLHSINTAIFSGAAFITGEFFVRKNNRLWTAREKWILIFGIDRRRQSREGQAYRELTGFE